MKIVIIGSGNVATHIAKALNVANVAVSQIWSYHYENASRLAKQINATAIADLSLIDTNADVCLIAVKDDEIANVISELSGVEGVLAHTSGAVNLNVFENTAKNYGVFYPLQTFSKDKEVDFSNIPLCVEGNNQNTLNILTKLAQQLSSNVVEVNSDKRKILHLAAVFACNFTNHMYALADEILSANNLDFDIIKPLITETANKVQNALPQNVQTGPAIRNDLQTLKRHEELLSKQPELLEIYKTLSESIKKTR
ncbi:MAG: DUF2520 domain-containing protein [Pedobacter sp.]|nr:MAG: DUF2520 domain-containing protein [Pedobacter sp.]